MKQSFFICFLLIFCFSESYPEFSIKRINDIPYQVNSIAYYNNTFLAATDKGLYSFKMQDSSVKYSNHYFNNNKFSMVRYTNNQFFAGRVDVSIINTEYCVLLNSDVEFIDWKEEYDTKFGDFSQFYLSDIVKYQNNLYLSMKGTTSSPGGHLYFFKNGVWDYSRKGYVGYTPYFDFYDLEILNEKIYCSVDPTLNLLSDDETDGSIMANENGIWLGKLSIGYIIYSLKSHKGQLFAGGKYKGSDVGYLLKTDGINPQKDGSGWKSLYIENAKTITSIQEADSILFIGSSTGQIFYSENAENNNPNFNSFNSEFSIGCINDMAYIKETKKLYVAANNGLFEINLAKDKPLLKYRLAGKVIDCNSLEALDSVSIQLDSSGITLYKANTNINGNYEIMDINPGHYTILSSKIGFNNYSNSIEIFDSLNSYNFCLKKNEPETISIQGIIKDCSNGNILSDVEVELFSENIFRTAFTNSDGFFSFSGLKTDSYKISFEKTDFHTDTLLLNNLLADTSITYCLNPIINPNSNKLLVLNIYDGCSNAPFEGVDIEIISNINDKIQGTSDVYGNFQQFLNYNVNKVQITVKTDKYYSDTINIDINSDTTLTDIFMQREIVTYILNINIPNMQPYYWPNDIITVKTYLTNDCQNIKLDTSKYNLFVKYDCKELYLLSHNFSIVDNYGYSELLDTLELLEFKVLIGNSDTTDIVYEGILHSNPGDWYNLQKVYKKQPFKIQKQSNNIIKNILPNPIINSVDIETFIEEEGYFSLKLIDINGDIVDVFSSNHFYNVGNHTFHFLMNKPIGKYFIVLESKNGLNFYPVIIE